MLQTEDEVRASLRLAVAHLPEPTLTNPSAPERSRRWPVLASAAAVALVAVAAGVVADRDVAPSGPTTVPFVHETAPTVEMVGGGIYPTSLDAPACRADDLAVDRVDNRPENHRRNVWLDLRNVSGRTCFVETFPDFDMVDAAGRVVPFPVDRVEHPYDATRHDVPPGRLVSVDGWWMPWCGPDPGTLRLRLRLPGGTLVTEPAFGVAVCHIRPLPTVEGVPGTGQLTLRPWRTYDVLGSARSALEVGLEVPDSVRRGSRLHFAAVLTNPTDRPVRLPREERHQPKDGMPEIPYCPVYELRLDVLPPRTGLVHDPIPWNRGEWLVLNCEATPEIPARSSMRFLMELDVPADTPVGRGFVSWDADQFGDFRSPTGRPSHDLWVELDVTD